MKAIAINAKAVKSVAKLAGKGNEYLGVRGVLTRIRITSDGAALRIEATDSYTLGRFTFELTATDDHAEFAALFPASSLSSLKTSDRCRVEIDEDGRAAIVTAAGVRIAAADEETEGFKWPAETSRMLFPAKLPEPAAVATVNPKKLAAATAPAAALDKNPRHSAPVAIRFSADNAALHIHAEGVGASYDALIMPVRMDTTSIVPAAWL